MINRLALVGTVTLTLLFTTLGCDTTDSDGDASSVRIEGRVTDDAGAGKVASTQAGPVEGATVTAARVESDGTLTQLEGEASTDAEGRYELDVDEASDVTVVMAVREDFNSQVLVARPDDGAGTVEARPMTAESRAEADVFTELRTQFSEDDAASPTAADVAAHVNADAAETVSAQPGTVASALRAAFEAEAHYLREENDVEDDDLEQKDTNERQAYLTLQSELHSATAASEETLAHVNFEDAYTRAFTGTNIDARMQAHARAASRDALVRFYEADDAATRFAVEKQATLLASLTVAHAVEASFEAADASQERIDALVNARQELRAELESASSEEDVEDARTTYNTAVSSELSGEIDIDSVILASAASAVEEAHATLEATIDGAASADEIASAHATFQSSSEAAVEEVLLPASTNASLGSRVLVLLSVH